MEITQTTPILAANAQNGRPAEKSASVISSDFETFLLMLTAQLENQDPLNPIESTDYAVQLATFSGVEQQVLTNDLLISIADRVGSQDVGQLATWVGMEARVAAPVVFDGQPVTLTPKTSDSADQAVLVVRNQFDQEVQRTEIGLSGDQIRWAGIDHNGNAFASGVYSFRVESYAEGALIGDHIPESYAKILEAKNDPSGVLLVLDSGSEVSSTQVTALRKPD